MKTSELLLTYLTWGLTSMGLLYRTTLEISSADLHLGELWMRKVRRSRHLPRGCRSSLFYDTFLSAPRCPFPCLNLNNDIYVLSLYPATSGPNLPYLIFFIRYECLYLFKNLSFTKRVMCYIYVIY